MQLSDDRTQATLAINKTLTAPEIENLIRELAMLRSQMTPEVTPAPQDSNGAGVPTMSQDNPTLAIQYPLEDAHVTVYLRSIGLGWTAWRLHPDTQRALAEFFNSRLPKSAPAKGKPIPFR
ncbi:MULTISPECIES: hypothetical protein [Acidovorax]|jgi:hypothetical protein|uniref:Transcriptional regulator n=1 Tax=Acidovorax facilis TaxID=12917 RepID=A0ABV8D6L6_9BURK|nr:MULTISPECIES: hypothetical protein [Acidovorax]KQB58652.1 hypothetical protein AE621_14325 [Acidovorax sp. SD340]MBO1009142.1 hypothetical protein [Acidovorax sp. SD340]MCO4240544.1 hypothetical protein [Acidovorax facilis]OGA63188.1 MAG: hypothetical protein A2710_12100 [Burkholderiales bacterium RIFCSPHIGHO2_01_FULL_64_960]